MKLVSKSVAALALALTLSAGAFAEDLGPGSAAPSLSVKEWFKGTPVTELAKDKVYVVEFWATWCGPCKTSIPHLTELAKKNQDVTFIGVSIWEDNDGTNISKFVKEMGEKMDYNVGYSGNQDGMAQTWMRAAGQNGIPSAFIVKDGTIQWIGHPMEMEKPLEAVKAGTYDLAAFKKEFDKEAEANRKQMEAQKEIQDTMALFDSGKRDEAKKKLDGIVAKNSDMAASADSIKFGWLAKEDPKAWKKEVTKLTASKDENSIMKVCGFAIRQVKAKGEALDQGKFAIQSALDGTKRNDFTVLQYADYFYRQTGDAKAQLETTTRLLELLPNSPLKDNADYKATLEKQKKELQAKLKG